MEVTFKFCQYNIFTRRHIAYKKVLKELSFDRGYRILGALEFAHVVTGDVGFRSRFRGYLMPKRRPTRGGAPPRFWSNGPRIRGQSVPNDLPISLVHV